MNALVGYGSSDEEEEEEEDVLPQRPAKVAKLNHSNAPEHLTAPLNTPTAHPEAHVETQQLKAPTIEAAPRPTTPQQPPPQEAPAQGPTKPTPHNQPPTQPAPPTHPTTTSTSSNQNPPFSPYTFTRQRLRELTMPPTPNFNIPSAPAPPAQNSEEAAQLAAVSKQFERFLELKKQNIHFNERLQNSTSLRNPSLLPKLMAFAGIEGTREGYESSLPAELGVPSHWPEDCYVEILVKGNEIREKKRAKEREGVEFVPARAGAGEEERREKTMGGEGKRSKFR